MQPPGKTCALTGANGFVGRKLKDSLQRHGWSVIRWVRRPEPGSSDVGFALGHKVAPHRFDGVNALVHCAYDFRPRKWDEIAAVNVAGSQELLLAARKAGVEVIVLISSLSAFPGCRSLYGKAKLQLENFAASVGAHVIRPGLVYGDDPGGMFGRLVKQVRGSRLVPVIWGGRQTQYLLHSDDLGTLVRACLDGQVPAGAEPIIAAHERAWELRELLAQIAQALGQPVTFLPMPWMFVWLGLRVLELARIPTSFRSDSLLSLVFQDPQPSFAPLQSLGFRCQPFSLTPAMLAP